MLVKTEGIVLQNIKYADKKVISKIYTKEQGLLTANIITGNAPNSKIKSGTILPLNQVEINFIQKQNRDVQQLTEVRTLFVYENLLRDPGKLAIAQFLNEVLCKCLKEHVANYELYQFITTSYRYLDRESQTTDFHVYFLFELTKFLGFEPHNTYDLQNEYFDTREGKYTPMELGFPLGLDKKRSKIFLELFDKELISKRFLAAQRSELLEALLGYYKMHVEGFNELRSYQVLKDVFA